MVVRSVDQVYERQFASLSDYYNGYIKISDGGSNTYDSGNYIRVPANSSNYLTYKSDCNEYTVNGQKYRMRLKTNGFSVTVFNPYYKDSISVSGGLGADGYGKTHKGAYSYLGWTGFWKIVVAESASPSSPYSVHHLWVTDAAAQHHISSNTNDDLDILQTVNGYNVVYLMWTTYFKTKSSESLMQDLVRGIANEMVGKKFKS